MFRVCCVCLLLMLSAASARAQYLSERLVPPQKVGLAPLPMVVQPAEPRVFGAEKPRSHLWSLPFGTFPGSPTVLTTEKTPAVWQRPALDLPALSSESDPARPQFPLQPIAPRTRMPAADPLGPAPLVRFAQAGESPVLPGDDPSATAALGLLTAAIPLASPNPLPLNRLSIPDPFEQILVIRLSSPPADDDGPAITQDRPAWAPFPPAEPAK